MKINQMKAGVVLSYIAVFLGTAVSLIYIPFMLRKLGQAEYGLFSLVNTTIAFLTILDFGFGNAIIRYTAKFRAEGNTSTEQSMQGMFLVLYTGIGIIAFLLGLLLVFNSENLFSKSFSPKELQIAKTLLWLAAFNLAINFPLSIFNSIIRAYERFVFAQVTNIIRLILNPLLMVMVLIMGYRSIGMIIITTILNIAFSFLYFFYCTTKLKIRPKFRGFDAQLLKEISTYSFFVFLSLIVERIYWSSGQFLLGIFSGTDAISIYTIGIQLTTYYMSLSSAVSSVFLPRITAMSVSECDSRQISDLFIKVGRLQFFILALPLAGFICIGKDFITLWAGRNYTESFWVTLILMVPLTIPLVQNLGITIVQSMNKHAFRSVLYFAVAILNILISIPLTKQFGVIGCAYGTAFAWTVGQIFIMNIYYYKIIKIDIPKFGLEIARMLPAVLVSSGIVFIFKFFIHITGFWGLIGYGTLLVLCYIFCMGLFGLNRNEKELIISPAYTILRQIKFWR